MDAQEFREFGYAAVDFVAEYLESLRERQVLPSVQPGYLHSLLPTEAPEHPESWKDVMKDIHEKIMPGMTHWQSPNFHAYYPTQTSYPAIVGDLIAHGFGIVGFSWICSPACTELEVIVMDWLGKLLDLPKEYLNCSEGPGGGVIQGSASEAVMVAMLTAREEAVKRLKLENPDMSESDIRGKLIMYSSDQSNSCVEKSALLSAVPIRLLPVGQDLALHGDELRQAIEEDIRNGLFPIACIATHGTTGTCAFDDLNEIGPICREFNIWLHIDSAYAGSAMCCPEFRHLMPGVEYGDSFNFNLHKMMMVNFDCCAMWFKNADAVVDSFTVDRIYLKHQFQGESKAPDYRHWQIPLGRRFRSLKVWILLRTVGVEGVRAKIRNYVSLAKVFEHKVQNDRRFEIVGQPVLGLVCFRLKGDCERTQKLLDAVTERKNIYVIPAKCHGKLMIRFVVAGFNPEERDIEYAWNEIISQADVILSADAAKCDLTTNFADKVLISNDSTNKSHII